MKKRIFKFLSLIKINIYGFLLIGIILCACGKKESQDTTKINAEKSAIVLDKEHFSLAQVLVFEEGSQLHKEAEDFRYLDKLKVVGMIADKDESRVLEDGTKIPLKEYLKNPYAKEKNGYLVFGLILNKPKLFEKLQFKSNKAYTVKFGLGFLNIDGVPVRLGSSKNEKDRPPHGFTWGEKTIYAIKLDNAMKGGWYGSSFKTDNPAVAMYFSLPFHKNDSYFLKLGEKVINVTSHLEYQK